jgi:hypothetical protein
MHFIINSTKISYKKLYKLYQLTGLFQIQIVLVRILLEFKESIICT